MASEGGALMQEHSAVTPGANAATGSQALAGDNSARRAKAADPDRTAAAKSIGQPDQSFAVVFSRALEAADALSQAVGQGQISLVSTADTVIATPIETVASQNADAVATGVTASVSCLATPTMATHRHTPPQPMRDATKDLGADDAADMGRAAVSNVQPPFPLPPPTPGSGFARILPKLSEDEPERTVDSSRVPAKPTHLIDDAPAAGTDPASHPHFAVIAETPHVAASTPERPVSGPITLVANAAADSLTAAMTMAHNRSADAPLTPVSAVTNSSAPPVAEPNLPGITPTDQIAPALIHLSTTDGARRISLQLTPSNLGTVDIQIDQPVSGPTTITLTVQHADTLALLHKDIEQLTKALDRAGFDDGARTISLHLAPSHTPLPEIAPASQSPPSHGQNPQSQGGAWQAAAFGQSANSQEGGANGDQHRPLQPTWQDWPGTGLDDDRNILVPSAPTRLPIRAGLNITA